MEKFSGAQTAGKRNMKTSETILITLKTARLKQKA